MQRTHRDFIDVGGLLGASLEDVSRALQQSLLPLVDHCRTHTVVSGQLRHCAFALHGLQRQAGLENSVMIPALLHILISSFLETSRRQIVASVTARLSGSSSMRGIRSDRLTMH
jgi:hypothetical protein